MSEKAVSASKDLINPAMPRPRGDYHCPWCDARYDRAGVCPKDGIPLRYRGKSKL